MKQSHCLFACAIALSIGCSRSNQKLATDTADTEFTQRKYSDSTDSDTGLRDNAVASTETDTVAPPIEDSHAAIQVIGGNSTTCFLYEDGTLYCWGGNAYGLALPPEERFQQVSMGSNTACGVTTEGHLFCWGLNIDAPEGTFTQVAIGSEHGCALKNDGSIVCWGDNALNQTNAPDDTFRQISTHFSITCGVKTDGTLACWGENVDGPMTPPHGEFTQVTVGGYHGCSLKPDGTVKCWGDNYFGQATPPEDTFTLLSSGEYFTCGLTTEGNVRCWGDDETIPPDFLDGSFQTIAAGSLHACATRADGETFCWGEDRYGECTLPGATYIQITGSSRPCGLKNNGTVDCMGLLTSTMDFDDRFYAIAVGAYGLGSCGVKVDGGGRCWRDYSSGSLVYCFPEDMDIVQLAVRSHQVWALTAEGTVAVCEGGELSYPEEDLFVQISGGYSHVCGIRDDGRVICWGLTDLYLPPPEGTFVYVSSGGYYGSRGGSGCDSCGVKKDGSIECWGYSEERPLPEPEVGSFSQVSVHVGCVCGIKTDSTASCWGEGCSLDDYSSAADVPDGEFMSVTSGGTYACGLRTDGQLICWGSIIRR